MDITEYVDALRTEIARRFGESGSELNTRYHGGGTDPCHLATVAGTPWHLLRGRSAPPTDQAHPARFG